MDRLSLEIFSDLFVNLAAGWIGVIVILPNFTKEKGKEKLIILTIDLVLAILSLGSAYLLRRLI